MILKYDIYNRVFKYERDESICFFYFVFDVYCGEEFKYFVEFFVCWCGFILFGEYKYEVDDRFVVNIYY